MKATRRKRRSALLPAPAVRRGARRDAAAEGLKERHAPPDGWTLAATSHPVKESFGSLPGATRTPHVPQVAAGTATPEPDERAASDRRTTNEQGEDHRPP